MKVSDNLYAEAVFYQLAASEGTRWASARTGRQYENALFEKLGLNARDYYVADGSGLSLYNYVSAELEVKMLRYAYQKTGHLRCLATVSAHCWYGWNTEKENERNTCRRQCTC